MATNLLPLKRFPPNESQILLTTFPSFATNVPPVVYATLPYNWARLANLTEFWPGNPPTAFALSKYRSTILVVTPLVKVIPAGST